MYELVASKAAALIIWSGLSVIAMMKAILCVQCADDPQCRAVSCSCQ